MDDDTRFSHAEFRMLLDLWMVSDPWPLSDKDNETFTLMLDDEAKAAGYDGVVQAYHEVERTP